MRSIFAAKGGEKAFNRLKLFCHFEKEGLAASLAELAGTGFYSGYSPLFPGTAGSAAALLFWPFLRRLGLVGRVAVTTLLYAIGVPVAAALERESGANDPGRVVIDEFVGMYITLLADRGYRPAGLVAAFFAFRFFDIIKPWPASVFNDGTGGFSIMNDDVAAGIYALASVELFRWVLSRFRPGLAKLFFDDSNVNI